jgi:NADPH2:quinone reductase
MLWRGNKSLHGVYFPSCLDAEHQRVHHRVSEILEAAARGEISVVIDRTFPLKFAQEAHQYVLSRRAFGRVLMRP